MTPLEVEWMNGSFREATEEQLSELLRLIDEHGILDTDMRVILGWIDGIPFPGGARKMIQLLKLDYAREPIL